MHIIGDFSFPSLQMTTAHNAIYKGDKNHAFCNINDPYCFTKSPFENSPFCGSTMIAQPFNNVPFCDSMIGQSLNNPNSSLCPFPLGDNKTDPRMNIYHGTTTLGFKYQGGILLAADSRATAGQYIGSQTMKKIIEINPYLIGTLAGGAADCVYWDRVLTMECRLYELRNGRRITVIEAGKIMSKIAKQYKALGLVMGMMIAGFDSDVPALCYVDSDGTLAKGNMFAVGSGSIFALGVLDSGYRWDLKDEDAQELGQRAVFHSTMKDAFSGGIVRVYHMTPNGWKSISSIDCKDLHSKYVI